MALLNDARNVMRVQPLDRIRPPIVTHPPNSLCHRRTCSANASGVSAATSISRSAASTGSSLPANRLACTSLGLRMCRAGYASICWCWASRSARTALARSRTGCGTPARWATWMP